MTDALQVPAVRRVATADEMHELGRELAGVLRAGDLVILSGPLGAGKTTLTRGIGEGLDVRGPVTSPTFVLARTHPSLSGGAPLVHVDAYRLSSALELDDLDIDFARSVVVVEWGAGMLDGVAESWLEVAIERPTGAAETTPAEADAVDETDEPRTVTLTGFGPRWALPAGSSPADPA
jgi:tRNA threonylcarbamoyl adenosine modification protein YjeE